MYVCVCMYGEREREREREINVYRYSAVDVHHYNLVLRLPKMEIRLDGESPLVVTWVYQLVSERIPAAADSGSRQ
jgi:hypothetical protein